MRRSVTALVLCLALVLRLTLVLCLTLTFRLAVRPGGIVVRH